MPFMDIDVEVDFSATYRSKGEIYGLCGTFKTESTWKKLLLALLFLKTQLNLLNMLLLYAQTVPFKHSLDKTLCAENRTIYSISGTRVEHIFSSKVLPPQSVS